VEKPNNSIYSVASLALRVIFSVSCGTSLVLSRSPSIVTYLVCDVCHCEAVLRLDTGCILQVHSANDWEHVDLGDEGRKSKFLRLMGANKVPACE